MTEAIADIFRPSRARLDLIAGIDAACVGPISALHDAVGDALSAACRSPGLLADAEQRGAVDSYSRHLLHADPAGRYTLVALVWQPGQFSPVHAHYTWCGYGVVSGILSERSYACSQDAEWANPLQTTKKLAGSVCFSHAGLADIHRLGNDSESTAVSIHAYGVDGARVATHVNRVVRSDA